MANESKKSILEARFFGFNLPYTSTQALMHDLHDKVCRRDLPMQLMLLEHEPVITTTRQHTTRSLKTDEDEITRSGITLAMADRGGDATFHGPGQLVGYPIIRLDSHIENYIRGLEQALLDAVRRLGIKHALLVPGFTGIWIKTKGEKKKFDLRKLVAIGVGVKNGVSKHGFAMNIDIDWQPFTKHIVPCGLKDRGVVTMREVFNEDSLEMPNYWDIVDTVSDCLSQKFFLELCWCSSSARV